MTDNILYIAEAVIALSNILLCYTQVLNIEISKTRQKIYLAYAGIILCNVVNICCGLKLSPAIVNTVCGLLGPLLAMDGKRGRNILLYPCVFIISSIMNMAVSFLMAIILKISQPQVSSNIALTLLADSFFTMLMAALCLIKRIKRVRTTAVLFFDRAIYIAMTIGAVVFYLLIGLVQYMSAAHEILEVEFNLLGFFLSFVGILFFLCLLWISATIYKNEAFRNEKNMLNLYLSEQEKYIQLILEKDKDMRKFRHDVKEHMYIVSKCMEQEDYKEAQRHISKLWEDFDKAQMKRYTGITAIDVIISEKKSYMEKKGISFACEINALKLPENIELYDVCTLLMNILNNAIEACECLEPPDKLIKLVVEVDGENFYLFEKNKTKYNVEFAQDGNPVTTKRDSMKHGFGSRNIRNVVKKYDGEIKYSVQNQCFIVEIII